MSTGALGRLILWLSCMSQVWRRKPAFGHGGGPRFNPDANPRSRRSSTSAGDRRPLLFAAGHLVRPEGGALGQAEPAERLERCDLGLACEQPVELERRRDVLSRGQPGQQVEMHPIVRRRSRVRALHYIYDRDYPPASTSPLVGSSGLPAMVSRVLLPSRPGTITATIEPSPAGWLTSASACAPAVRANASSESPVRGLVLLAGNGFEPRGADAFELLAAPAASLPRCRSFWLAGVVGLKRCPLCRAVVRDPPLGTRWHCPEGGGGGNFPVWPWLCSAVPWRLAMLGR